MGPRHRTSRKLPQDRALQIMPPKAVTLVQFFNLNSQGRSVLSYIELATNALGEVNL